MTGRCGGYLVAVMGMLEAPKVTRRVLNVTMSAPLPTAE
jgi:hypothetical protein